MVPVTTAITYISAVVQFGIKQNEIQFLKSMWHDLTTTIRFFWFLFLLQLIGAVAGHTNSGLQIMIIIVE